ncbi:carboxylesteras-like protein [Aaosphaeria arxii CBS 175.79]|uniref:Carboxylic ester hydrolase n=1 Tax=Aaosphaeria arxii CBS 175.79 TaxID=1450172 RepID=A0A6A5XA64_9PLEO|nr:carboxylesteras-like protein [Aaosphaeria arxii CBS 175.79]KAF2009810.1 carboxylesteras-like protein [Aaosphaeria arxii CBS 175.79]
MSDIFQHNALGQLQGNLVDGTVQFLGLKYGSLKNRFAPSELVTSYEQPIKDCTRYGPPPVSPAGAIHTEFGFIQKSLPLPAVPEHSDLEGLNLNVTVPQGKDGVIDTNANLPVYVFIHGGGFAVGSSWYPHYNSTPLVRLSTEIGKPVIGVSINYRLGVPGFLTSRELRDAGYKPNNGYRDQRTALTWVKRFIGGFGGNPDELTVAGESAGGLSVAMLLLSEEPLMSRCLTTGGAMLLFKPIPEAETEATYQSVIEALGLADKSSAERIQGLLDLPVDDLWQKVPPGAALIPTLDGETVPGTPSFEIVTSQDDHPEYPIPGRRWCKGLMIGDSQLDANILCHMGLDNLNPGIASKFIRSVRESLREHPEAAEELFKAYDLSPSTDDDEAMLTILRFASEIAFYAAAISLAKGWPQTEANKVFLYHFNEGIPWEGRFQGEAGHILDVAYLFQNYNDHLTDAQKAVARTYGEDFIKFVNGEDPWPPVQNDQIGARVYGPSDVGRTAEYVGSADLEKTRRHDRILKLGELAGFDSINAAFHDFFLK